MLPSVGCLDEARLRRGRSDSKLIAHVPDDVTMIMNGSSRILPGRAETLPYPISECTLIILAGRCLT